MRPNLLSLVTALWLVACIPDGRIDPTTWDGDEDGWVQAEDCDDLDPNTHPGAEDPPYDGVDQDCAGDDDYDADGDGWHATAFGGEDCDDQDPGVHPDAEEQWYDGVDQDCDGANDYDADGDGVTATTDCDDEDPSVHPGAEELCDGVDQDCDGEELGC